MAATTAERGQGLAAGDLISSGTCSGMLRPKAGQHLRARFGAGCEVVLALR